jgi:hypothetical protein
VRKCIVAERSKDTLSRVGTGVMDIALCVFSTSVLAFMCLGGFATCVLIKVLVNLLNLLDD